MKVKLVSILCMLYIVTVVGCGKNTESINTNAVVEKFEPISIKSALPVEGMLVVPVARFDQYNKENLLISTGIPFSIGQIFSDKNIVFYDESGIEIPIAVKTLATWPQDNSLRSILVQFRLDIPYKYRNLTFRWGASRVVKDLPLQEVNWEIPQGMIILPSAWLCKSMVTGAQVPIVFDRMIGKPITKYDQRAVDYFSSIKDRPLKEDDKDGNYYDTTHVFYQLYARSADEDLFKFARKSALHYRDKKIILDGPERGRDKDSKKTRYIYLQAMIDDYLFTGDTRSLEIAGYMAEYLKKAFPAEKAFFPKHATKFWTEREAAFPLLGIVSYYELTHDREYLDVAGKIAQNLYRTQMQWSTRGGFIHNLYSHDPEEGARKDEYGGSPFMTGLLLEGIIKYHQLTGSIIAKESIFMALDWLIKECLAPDGSSFVYTTAIAKRREKHPDLNLLIAHAFGYGYKISGYTRKDYFEIGKKIFDYGVQHARLGDQKHFNQNYRSSGHFLAYVLEK